MDALVFDAEMPLDVEEMPLSRIAYWLDRAVKRAEAKKKQRR